MSKIKKVDGMPKYPELEDKVTAFWKEKEIFKKSVDQRSVDNSYSFVDGPPFVSGMPHYGHLLTSIAKDVVPRYWTMKGKRVRRVWGWDCHGLPIEEKVNKKFGIKSSAQLEEEMGVERYVQECRNWVESTSDDWKWYIDKIGRWVDMDNAYYTMHPEFMESVIWGFKQMHEKGYVYKGKRVSLFSTDTSTPVSNFEVAMDPDNYRDVQDLSIFVKFYIKSFNNRFGDIQLSTGETVVDLLAKEKVSLVAWTTTPWTIPANFALAVNPKVDYVLVKFEGQYLILAKPRLEYTFKTTEEHIGATPDKLVQVLAEFKGTELEGVEYHSVYDFFADRKTEKDYHVYLYEGVTIEDGSGVLHVAPAFGEEDFNLGKQYGLSGISDIDEEGKMTVGEWKGVYLRTACEPITEDLEKRGNLLRSEWYTHRVPFYRGENPLIYMAQDSYFIDVQKIKAKMAELNQEINWIPDHIKDGRFAQTIEGSPDWAISRNRYWATILPIWKNEDGDEIVVGSFEEMMQYTDQITKREVDGKKVYEFEGKPMDLHRDVCDKLVFTKDSKEYRRIPEVLDCWMDSGSVPHAEHHYPFENKEAFENAFPADFIVEYVGQVRAWFNVLLRITTLVFAESENPKLANKPTFTNVICTGVLAGNDGRKMSKSYGNYPDPKDILEKVGGEALRLYLMGAPIMVGGDMSWSDEMLNEQVKNVLLPIWNTYKYLTIYADLHNWTPEHARFTSENVLDKWLESYMNKVSFDYAKAMESYNLPESVKLIQPAIDNISSWWIRRSRDRFAEGDVEAMQTLYAALVQFMKTFAPQMPFVTEEMYQNLVVDVLPDAKESVHLDFFPEVSEESIDYQLLVEMELTRQVCTLGQSIRVTNALKVRQPLAKAYVSVNETMPVMQFVPSANFKSFHPKLTSQTQSLVRNELLEVVKDELNVKAVEAAKELPAGENLVSKEENGIGVALDTKLTQELKEEGQLAELKRQIQNLRKTSGLQMGEFVKVQFATTSETLRSLIEKYNGQIAKEITASEVVYTDGVETNKIKVDDAELFVAFVK
jgi:isoleucyl-tRNA synthetase